MFDVYEYTSVGGRECNEDSLGSLFDENGGIFVVADGLGGHALGDVASHQAVETIISDWNTATEDISGEIERRFEKANNNILDLQQSMKAVMKTTAAVLAISGSKVVCANSGDSRVYVIHRNSFAYCTNDHSVAFKKYRSGEITREQIAFDEDQSSLLRTLGGKSRYEPEIYSPAIEAETGDGFMLCSDGAWEYLRDEEILIDYLKSSTAKQWSELLMLRIMERLSGGNDNLSLMTIIIK